MIFETCAMLCWTDLFACLCCTDLFAHPEQMRNTSTGIFQVSSMRFLVFLRRAGLSCAEQV